MKKTHAFTLIELLVVISIISVLIAILLPALSKAKKAAQAIQCAANTRQILVAFNLYSSDYNDFYPTKNQAIGATNPVAGTGVWPRISYFPWWLSYTMLYTGEASLGDARKSYGNATNLYDCPTNPQVKGNGSMATNYAYNVELGYDFVPSTGQKLGRPTLFPKASTLLTLVDAGNAGALAGTTKNWQTVQAGFGQRINGGSWHDGAYNAGFLDSHVGRAKMPSDGNLPGSYFPQ